MTKKLKTLVAPNQPTPGQTLTIYSVAGRLVSEFDAILKHDAAEITKTDYKVLNPLKFKDMYVLRNLNDHKTYVLKRFNGNWDIT